jgi:hypothetical protein
MESASFRKDRLFGDTGTAGNAGVSPRPVALQALDDRLR